MGTEIDCQPEEDVFDDRTGIIPRTITALFERTTQPARRRSSTILSDTMRIPRRCQSDIKLRPVSMIALPRRGSAVNLNDKSTKYTMHVSFIEIYNEEIIDLLNSERTPISIHEAKGRIQVIGIKEVPVECAEDVQRQVSD
ncbi:hypothetical protein EC973_004085 [Apophysomyces ossiformis]|uniref:Kinesin motor domain-containing protein n=1 Tax=Apophysomyces ossiformis TaxID=679940 RepID=A0A8H7BGI4_9FUNG|nr:hypothetical protein EC973_004085 [Apophysomyces ossiformis]